MILIGDVIYTLCVIPWSQKTRVELVVGIADGVKAAKAARQAKKPRIRFYGSHFLYPVKARSIKEKMHIISWVCANSRSPDYVTADYLASSIQAP